MRWASSFAPPRPRASRSPAFARARNSACFFPVSLFNSATALSRIGGWQADRPRRPSDRHGLAFVLGGAGSNSSRMVASIPSRSFRAFRVVLYGAVEAQGGEGADLDRGRTIRGHDRQAFGDGLGGESADGVYRLPGGSRIAGQDAELAGGLLVRLAVDATGGERLQLLGLPARGIQRLGEANNRALSRCRCRRRLPGRTSRVRPEGGCPPARWRRTAAPGPGLRPGLPFPPIVDGEGLAVQVILELRGPGAAALL